MRGQSMHEYEHTIATALYWMMIVMQCGLIVWFAETGRPAPAATAVLCLGIGLLAFPDIWPQVAFDPLGGQGFWSWLRGSPGTVLVLTMVYALVGMVWAMFRWWLLAASLRKNYEREKAAWLSPGSLQHSAEWLRARAETSLDPERKRQLLHWSDVCRSAARAGGNQLTRELKPVWKEFVEHGIPC